MKEGLQKILDENGMHDGWHFILHNHLTEAGAENPYLSAIQKETGGVVFIDGQYYRRVGVNNHVEGHEAVRDSVPGGNMAEEWILYQLTLEEAVDHVTSSFEFDSQRFGRQKQTPSAEYVNQALAFIRGEGVQRP